MEDSGKDVKDDSILATLLGAGSGADCEEDDSAALSLALLLEQEDEERFLLTLFVYLDALWIDVRANIEQ